MVSYGSSRKPKFCNIAVSQANANNLDHIIILLYHIIIDFFTKNNIPFTNNIIGFAADGEMSC